MGKANGGGERETQWEQRGNRGTSMGGMGSIYIATSAVCNATSQSMFSQCVCALVVDGADGDPNKSFAGHSASTMTSKNMLRNSQASSC